MMKETDIIVAPLTENLYNRCKSSIKFIEASSAKKPGVWQGIRQYQEAVDDGKNGFLASTSREWYESIKKLVDDKELRREMGKNAFKTVKEQWQVKDNLDQYGQFFKETLLTRLEKVYYN